MKRLVFHSNQILPASEKVERAWLDLLGKPHPTIGYIPSRGEPERRYFQECQAYYAHFGAQMPVCFELDAAYAPGQLPALLACDAIHLSGGDTFYFLHWLRRRGMLGVLQRYVAAGGLLIGVSAGAILMTADIAISACYGDAPLEGDSDWTGLGLVDFAFVPHLDSTPDGIRTMQEYAALHQLTVYGCRDGDGLIVQEQQVRCIGDVVVVQPANPTKSASHMPSQRPRSN